MLAISTTTPIPPLPSRDPPPIIVAPPQPRAEIYEPHLALICMASDLVDLHESDLEESREALAAYGWQADMVDLYFDRARGLALCAISDRLMRRRDALRILSHPEAVPPLAPAAEATPSAAIRALVAGALTAAIVLLAMEMLLS
jgi:hypothetical protein